MAASSGEWLVEEYSRAKTVIVSPGYHLLVNQRDREVVFRRPESAEFVAGLDAVPCRRFPRPGCGEFGSGQLSHG